MQFQLLIEAKAEGGDGDARRLVFENGEPINIKLELLMAHISSVSVNVKALALSKCVCLSLDREGARASGGRDASRASKSSLSLSHRRCVRERCD